MKLVLVAVCALVGLVAGPYVNLVVDRGPRRTTPVRSPYGAATAWRHGLLFGRAGRVARRSDGRRRLLVDLGTAVLFAAAALRLGLDWALPAFCAFLAVLLAVSVIDVELHIVPNRVVYPTLATAVPLLGLAAVAGGEVGRLRSAVAGGLVAFAILCAIHLAYPAGMGFGDVRLAGVLGVFLGWLGVGHVVLALFVGFLSSSVVSVGLIAARRADRKSPIPFGPFLGVGALVALLFGRDLIAWYRR